MPIRYVSILLFVASATLLISGCSTQAWYEGLKSGAENECDKQPPGALEQCQSRVNRKTYEDYEKERSRQKP